MPVLCCCTDEDAVVTATTTNTTNDRSGNVQTPMKMKDDKAVADHRRPQQESSSRDKEERQLAESIYHDARQSLTESMILSQIPYHPATSSFVPRKFQLDTLPEEMIGGDDDLEDSDEMSSKRKAKEVTTPPNSVVAVKKELQAAPKQKQHGPKRNPGYPGTLTVQELETTLEFRRMIKDKKVTDGETNYYDMVHVYDGIEPEAFALCRFMRARKFNIDGILELMDKNFKAWDFGKASDFYPRPILDKSLPTDHPTWIVPILKTQLPILNTGVGKNGSMVCYFKVEDVSVEALDCIVDMESNMVPYFWYLFYYAYRQRAIDAQQEHPTIQLLFEVTMIIDLKGINRGLFSDKIMTVIKDVLTIFNCFPEVLSKLIFTNAPFFFSAIWMIIKQFLDPRTVQKVSIFHSQTKSISCMTEFIDKSQILSDYEGTLGLSFNEVIQSQIQQEEDIQNFIIERFYFTGHHKPITYKFDVGCKGDDMTVTIVVFTRSTSGATFIVDSSKSAGSPQTTLVKPPSSKKKNSTPSTSNGQELHPYSLEIFKSKGQGKQQHITITANQNAAKKDYFLLAIRIV